MPARRASASGGHVGTSPNPSMTRIHRPNDSFHVLPNNLPPNAPYNANSTPQQRVVHTLVNRLKHRLPIHSGLNICQVEADEALQQAIETLINLSHETVDVIAWAIAELLDKFAKMSEMPMQRNSELLQSQLMLLKTLCVALAVRWKEKSKDSDAGQNRPGTMSHMSSMASLPGSPINPTPKRRGLTKELPIRSALWTEPPPLDDNCARYILIVMILYLRQTAPPETNTEPFDNFNFTTSFHDFETTEYPGVPSLAQSDPSFGLGITSESVGIPRSRRQRLPSPIRRHEDPSVPFTTLPQHFTHYEKTSQMLYKSTVSLSLLITKYVGRVLYHLSASNWPMVLEKIKKRIHILANSSDDGPDIIDLQLIAYSLLDRNRLGQILSELSSLLVNMKPEAQLSVAIPLRCAVWNWVEQFPEEFQESLKLRGRGENAPERVYDVLHTKDTEKNPLLWPTLTALMCISSVDRVSSEFRLDGTMGPLISVRGKPSLAAMLTKVVETRSKYVDTAVACLLDFARGAIRAQDGEPLMYAVDIAHELKRYLMTYQNMRPFWESDEEIDVGIISDILVVIFRFIPEEESTPIFQKCLDQSMSCAVKICAVRALTLLSIERHRVPWQRPLTKALDILSPLVRYAHIMASLMRSDHDGRGAGRTRRRPRARKDSTETHDDRELLIFAIMTLWRADLPWHTLATDTLELADWVPNTMVIWSVGDPGVNLAVARAYRFVQDRVFNGDPTTLHFESEVLWLKLVTPASIIVTSYHLLNSRFDYEAQQMWMGIAYGLMESFAKVSDKEYVLTVQRSPDRVTAFLVLEIACLVSLTSLNINVSLTAAHCLRLISEVERFPDVPLNGNMTEEDRAKRYPIYDQLGDPKVPVVGRVAHQKRMRKLVRLIASPNPMYIAVWEECLTRARLLGDTIKAGKDDSASDEVDLGVTMSQEDRQAQWQNLTLFLAAFGASCVKTDMNPRALTQLVPASYLPDSMCNLRNPDEMLTGFLNLLIELLVSDSPFVRNTSRDALGGELSPKLYDRVFKLLYEVIQDITSTGGAPDLDWSETFSNFLEQFISVIKSLIEHVASVEDFMSVDVMGVLRAFSDFLTRFDDPACAPIRIKFCALCDTTLDNLAKVGIRKDAYHRQTILEMIMGWLQDPSVAVNPQQQFDLNMASLRTLVRLFEKLQLKPLDNSGDDPFVFVMRLLGRYHSACFRLLEFTGSVEDVRSDSPLSSYRIRIASKEVEVRELIIESFSRAVNANTEPGLKHCLNYAYDPNLRTRTTFARIFAKVLLAGTRFDAPGIGSTPPKQSVLCELVKGPDLMLAVAICETCPPDEANFIIPIMLNLFDSRASLLALLKMLVDREVSRADDSRSLFRGNSTSARLLGAFTKIHGYNYLRSLIQPLVQVMKEMPPGHSYVMDPALAAGQDTEQNRKNVEIVSAAFLQVVMASIHSLPAMIHELCSHIGKTVNEVWPDAKFPALGAFMFLRFISPAIVSPESIDIEIPKENEPTMRKGLMVVARVVQNLANNMFFGKQAHMAPLNDFLKNNIVVVTRFLSDLNKYDTRGDPPDPEEWIGLPYDDTDSIVLHRFFDKHADKVGKELLSLSRPSEADAPAINGKKAWDNLCAALVDLDSSVPPSQPSPLDRSSHEGYLEFVGTHIDADTSSVSHLFIDSTPPDDEDVTVFILFAAKIEADTINMELLVYHVFRTMMDPRRVDRPYDIIIDLTAFAAGSQPPVQWLKFITEITPSDLRARKRSIYFLNMNDLAHRFLRKIRNLSAGEWSTAETYCSSLAELREFVSPAALEPLAYASQLEAEESQEFTDVAMRREQPARIQVTLDVRSTHLRLTTVIPQSVATLATCRLTEVVSLADISDVYNVSTGHDPDEFIIRKIRHGITLYFSSPARDSIIKAIRTAKGSVKNVQVAGPERFSRLTNVTATLLQIGMISSIYDEEDLRESGLELLSAICNYLDYDGPAIVPMRGALISRQTSFLVVQLSERLSQHAPQLTLDFLNEAALGMERSTVQQKIHCLQYMSPWIRNLVHFADPTTRLFDQSGARLRDCIRFLINLTLQDEQVYAMVQQYIWSEICKLDSPAVNIVLDELMRTAVDGPVGSRRSEIITDTVGTLSSINVRGRIFSKLRKVIGKTTLKPTPALVENPHWNEIAALTRLALVSTSQCKQAVQMQLFVPEIVHLVTLISATGAVGIRLSVHGIVMNMLQTLTVGRSGETPSPEIRILLDECASSETLRLFGLVQSTTTGEYTNFDPSNERMFINYQESLTQLLARILEGISGSRGLLNVWRARWMSLVSSTAFQYSPAVQTRAFITLGTLAVSDVDDDLFYQMIVALKKVLSETKQSDTDLCMILSVLRCFVKLVPSLSVGSRFFPQLFWLGVALLQTGIMGLFMEAAELLRIALENMMSQGAFDERGVSSTLLSERAPMEEVSVQLDLMLSLSFDSSFSFSLAAILFKGMRHQALKEAAGSALRSLLKIASRCKGGKGEMPPNDTVYYDSLGYFLALIPLSTTPEGFKKLLEDANTIPEVAKEPRVAEVRDLPEMPLTLLGICDPTMALLSTAFISSVLTTCQIDDTEMENFYSILSDIGDKYPEVIALAYENLHERIKYIFANCTHPDIMTSVSNLFKIAMHQESARNIHLRGSSSTLSTVGEEENHRRTIGELEDMGMSGLAYTFSFIQPSGDRGNILMWVTQLVDKMIE